MTDEQSTPLPAPVPTAAEAAPAKPSKPARPKPEPKPLARLGGWSRTLIALALLLSLAAAGGVGFLVYWSQMKRVAALEEMVQLKNELNDRTVQLTQLRNEMNQTVTSLQQDRQAIQKAGSAREDLSARMAALENQIGLVTGSHRIDWMLKEIEHFIQLAERRVSLLGDAQGALALLQEADTIARDLNEPVARNLREALTRDIHELKLAAESNLDIDGIFLRISRLVARVPQLNIPRYELFQEEADLNTAELPPEDGLGLFWYRFTEFLSSLVRYQKHEKQKPVLLTAQRDYLAQSITLLLEQAQLALLRGDNNAYRLSLKEARNRINSFQLLQEKESRIFMTELDALASIRLRPQMPTLENSVRAVQVFREFWTNEKVQREQAVIKLQLQQAQENARQETQP